MTVVTIIVEPTDRGFSRGEFIDRYRSRCSIQKSSMAADDCLWLGVDHDFNGKECTRMHLTRGMVQALLPMLQQFAVSGELPTGLYSAEEPA